MSIKKKIKKGVLFLLQNIPTKKVKAEVCVLGETELLKGRRAVVTGGTSGIGLEIAKAFVNSGATVVIVGRSRERIENAINNVGSGKCKGLSFDVTDIAGIPDMVRKATTIAEGDIDILVNNAGCLGGTFSEVSEEEYDKIMTTNLKSSVFISREYAKYMISNSIKGNILNIASSSSYRPATSAYALSKWGVRGMTEGLACSLAKYGIVVNAIAPGPTLTPMLKENNDDNIYAPKSLMGRMILPEEIASMAVIMTSKIGRALIGQVLLMTGGAGTINNKDFNFDF